MDNSINVDKAAHRVCDFHSEPDSEIIKYIFENKGKRLEKVGK